MANYTSQYTGPEIDEGIAKGMAVPTPTVGTDTGKVVSVNASGAYELTTLPAAGMTNPMTATGDIIVGGTSGTPDRLGKGTSGYLLAAQSSGLGYTNALPILTSAPTSANTSGVKIVVLSSEPVTKYSGYLYIILGG